MLVKSIKEIEKKEVSKSEAFQIIRAYLLEQRELGLRKMLDQESFKGTSWSEQHAYDLGFIKAIEKIRLLIPDQGTNV